MYNFTIFFENPWLMFVLIPAVALVLIPFFRVRAKYRVNRNRVTSLVILLIVMLLSVSALAGMRFGFDEPIETNEIIFLVDLSYSTREAFRETEEDSTVFQSTQSIREFVSHALSTMLNAEGEFRAGVVTFGKDAILAAEPSLDSIAVYRQFSDSLLHNLPDYRATNIENALRFTAEQFDNPAGARIVLITDGLQTDGSAESAIIALMLSGIRVDIVPVSSILGNEFQLIDIILPEFQPDIEAYNPTPSQLGVVVQSSFNGPARLTLYVNGEQSTQEVINVTEGIRAHNLEHTFTTSGAQLLSVTIECLAEGNTIGDTTVYNNFFMSYFYVQSFDSILIIYRIEEERNQFLNMLTQDGATSLNNIEFRYVFDEMLVIDANHFQQWHKIILINVGNNDMIAASEQQGMLPSAFAAALNIFVQERGGGLLVIGGSRPMLYENGSQMHDAFGNPLYVDNVFNRNDMEASPVPGFLFQQLLPVEKFNWLPPIAVAIVVDVSGSMQAMDTGMPGISRLRLAQEAAIAAVGVLMPQDYVVLISFDTHATIVTNHVAYPDPPNGLVNVGLGAARIRNSINSLVTAGGTMYIDALNMARNQLLLAEGVSHRHILFLTDGLPAHPLYVSNGIIQHFHHYNQITLSAVGISGQTETVIQMARYGHGRYFLVNSEEEMNLLPFNLALEMSNPALRVFTPEPFYAIASTGLEIPWETWYYDLPQHPTGGIASRAMPNQFSNFTAASRRHAPTGNPTTLLTGPFNMPIYTRWNLGAGTVGALTANIFCGHFGRNVLDDNTAAFTNFLLNALRVIAPVEDLTQDRLTKHVAYDNFTRNVTVLTSQTTEGDLFEIEIMRLEVDGNGEVTEVYISSKSLPAHGGASFSFAVDTGIFRIRVSHLHLAGDNWINLFTSEHHTIFSYSLEFNAFRCKEEAEQFLYNLLELGGGYMITDTLSIIEDFEPFRPRVANPTMPFIIIALILFTIDIAVRKFKWKWPWELSNEKKLKKLETSREAA